VKLEFCVLSSGSKANCLYIGSASTRVLIDCGLSGREVAKRLSQIGVDADSINAIVLTHEHNDHVAGARVFARRHKASVYANRATMRSAKGLVDVPVNGLMEFSSGASFAIGDLRFEPFSVNHDAAEPVGFRVRCGNLVLGVATDLGQVTTLVRERLRDVHALVLESNHDPKMLSDCGYPWELKQRISSRCGHLSNECAGALLEEISSENSARLQIAVAAHISENSNTPGLALEVFRSSWERGGNAPAPEFAAGSVYNPTGLYRLG
jgi:phosphoribosyl 1,2-cyclic phosphodiesterase